MKRSTSRARRATRRSSMHELCSHHALMRSVSACARGGFTRVPTRFRAGGWGPPAPRNGTVNANGRRRSPVHLASWYTAIGIAHGVACRTARRIGTMIGTWHRHMAGGPCGCTYVIRECVYTQHSNENQFGLDYTEINALRKSRLTTRISGSDHDARQLDHALQPHAQRRFSPFLRRASL